MSKNCEIIQGSKISLKEINEDYLGCVMEWRNRPDISSCFFSRSKFTLQGQRMWLDKYRTDETDKMFIILTSKNVPIGTIALYHIDNANKKAELGRILIADRQYLGKGFATEALKLILNYAFDVKNLNRVYLEVFADNTSAVSLYEKCGFEKEGLFRDNYFDGNSFRDVLVMGILSRDFYACKN